MGENDASARPPSADDEASPAETGVAYYKRILQSICDNRPSGTRGRLATALGTNRSFVSQLVNPAYAVPIPAQHLNTIFEVCHFPSPERQAFLDAYDRAHPGRRNAASALTTSRMLKLEVPDLGGMAENEAFDAMIREHVGNLAKLLSR